MAKRAGRRVFPAFLPLLGGCEGPQSALQPAGVGAQRIAELFWWMGGAALMIWILVVGLAVYASHLKSKPHGEGPGRWLIIGGGAVFPSIALAGLLSYGLLLLPSLRSPQAEPDLRIAVSGEQWWWRVRYLRDGGEGVELANELRLPVGQTAEFILSSPDVIHSFWVPSLGGKVDMIPGRETRLWLTPTRTGIYHGVCAEYCGVSHALMKYRVVVMEAAAFAAWLDAQAAPAPAPADALAERGREAFLANGCGACHSIRGTAADGRVGPDLTHVGGRLSLGAGILPNEAEAFARWIGHTPEIKPGVKMPAFGMLPEDQVAALAAYLQGLQ